MCAARRPLNRKNPNLREADVADTARQVIREHHFERDLRELIADAREADAFVEAAEFVLARDPYIGAQLTQEMWFLPMAPLGDADLSLYLHVR